MSETEKKATGMSTFKKAMTVIGAVTALVGASMPGIIEFIDDSEERAEKKAEESAEGAKKSEEKADLAYEILVTKVSHIDNQIDRQDEEIENLRVFIRDIIMVKMMELAENNRRPVRIAPRRSPASSGSGGGYGMGAGMSIDTGEEEEAIESVMDEGPRIHPPVQAQLPDTLDEAWRSQKGD